MTKRKRVGFKKYNVIMPKSFSNFWGKNLEIQEAKS